jgi:hypothetical protein
VVRWVLLAPIVYGHYTRKWDENGQSSKVLWQGDWDQTVGRSTWETA